jgi:hypothetical protein
VTAAGPPPPALVDADTFARAHRERDGRTLNAHFAAVCLASFRTHPLPPPDLAEGTRRGALAMEAYDDLRAHHPIAVVLDQLPAALAARLDGRPYVPVTAAGRPLN